MVLPLIMIDSEMMKSWDSVTVKLNLLCPCDQTELCLRKGEQILTEIAPTAAALTADCIDK